MVISWPLLHNPIFQFVVSVPVYGLGFWYFGRSAYHSLKSGVPNMDVLIFLGAFSAFFYSVFGVWYYWNLPEMHQFLFFETGATIITLVLFGNVIEKRSVKKTASALEGLVKLQVQTAKVLSNPNDHNSFKEKEVKLIQSGEVILVNSGDLIPLDGKILFGDGSCDERLISGESLPVYKKLSDKITGGTILMEGNIGYQVTATMKDGVLAQIVEMVKNAQSSKPNIQKLGDRVSAVFVPAVVLVALATFCFTYFYLNLGSAQSMLRAVAVLVISCPCAMGLATPTAIMVGIGKAAKHGIIIKGGEVLENFAKSKTILFDKTGTLSTGNFEFTHFNFDPNHNAEELKNIIWNLEKFSSHPIAKALVNQFSDWNKEGVEFIEVQEEKGLGISAKDKSQQCWKIGSARYTGMEGKAHLFLTRNGIQMASWNIEDETKKGAEELIAYFDGLEMRTFLLSGDQKEKVELVANKLNMTACYGEMMPSEKLAFIEKLVQTEPIVMVGDGINDAPALSKVSVGISFAEASDIAIRSANLVLMRPDLLALKDAHLISRQTYQTIKQNLFWAFFYNILCIPLAAAGFMHPMLGALSMAFSDVIVVGNSLRLGWRKLK